RNLSNLLQLHVLLEAQRQHFTVNDGQFCDRGSQGDTTLEFEQLFKRIQLSACQPIDRRGTRIVDNIPAAGSPLSEIIDRQVSGDREPPGRQGMPSLVSSDFFDR